MGFGYISHDLYLNQGQTTGNILMSLPSHFMEGLLELDSHSLTGYYTLGYLPLLTLGALLFLLPKKRGGVEMNHDDLLFGSRFQKETKVDDLSEDINLVGIVSKRSLSILKDCDIIYYGTMYTTLKYANILNRNVDRGLLEVIGPLG